jgi:hypothetical protein
MSAVWPAGIKSFTTKVNNVNVVDAGDVDSLQDEVNALETILGVNPHGSYLTVADRLAALNPGAYPTPITVVGPAQSITATEWAYLPSQVSTIFTLPAPAIVQASYGAWLSLGPTPSTNDVRLGCVISTGATISPTDPSWGAVPYLFNSSSTDTAASQGFATKTFTCNAGASAAALYAYRTNTSSTAAVSYAFLTITVLRWL